MKQDEKLTDRRIDRLMTKRQSASDGIFLPTALRICIIAAGSGFFGPTRSLFSLNVRLGVHHHG